MMNRNDRSVSGGQHSAWKMVSLSAVLLVFGTACPRQTESGRRQPASVPPPTQNQFQKVASGFRFPEGPAWDGTALFVSNCYGGWIARITHGRVDTFLVARATPPTFGKTNGLVCGADGNLYACDFGLGAILRISPDGDVTVVADQYQGEPFSRPNDLAFDSQGWLWFSDTRQYDPSRPDGRLYRVHPADGRVVLAADSIAYPNGLAFSGDGRWLYVSESAAERVLRFEVSADGRLRNRTVFISLPGGDPDGLAIDRNGSLYIAHFGRGKVVKVSTAGELLQEFSAPGLRPSNIEFGGSDLRTLFLTEDETNAVYRMTVDIAGEPLFWSPVRL